MNSRTIKISILLVAIVWSAKMTGDIWEQALVLRENYPQMCKTADGHWEEVK